MGDRHDERNAATMTELWEKYEREHLTLKSDRSQVDEKSMWNNIILPPFGKMKLTLITASEIDSLHRDITNIRKTPVRANRVIEVLRKSFNLAIRWKWLKENPVTGVRRNPEEKRNRYLNKQEIAALVRVFVVAAIPAHSLFSGRASRDSTDTSSDGRGRRRPSLRGQDRQTRRDRPPTPRKPLRCPRWER